MVGSFIGFHNINIHADNGYGYLGVYGANNLTLTVSDWAEIGTAVGTIFLGMVTVCITVYQNRKTKRDKIENWKDSHLNSHYITVVEKIKVIQNQIWPSNKLPYYREFAEFGFERLYTACNHWGLFNEFPLISNNEVLEVDCLIDRSNIALQHVLTGYPLLNKKINEINSMEERYKNCIRENLQNFIDLLYRQCKSEFAGWIVKPDIYKPIENVSPRIIEFETTKENTPVIKEIYIAALADSLLESIIEGGSDIRAEKEVFGGKVDSFNISLTLKKGSLDEFKKLFKVAAKTQNYNVTNEELLKFSKIWINLNLELKNIKEIYEERERIMANCKELTEALANDILNKYGAGFRIMGECDICKLIKDAREDEIRPYVN